jgi:hypothetical protein
MSKSLDQMSDAELADLHTKELGLEQMSDDQLLALHAESTKPEPIGPLETAGKQALDTFTMGHGPNAIAGVKKLVGATDDYASERDSQRAQLEQGTRDNPKSSMAGTAAGMGGQIAATALVPELTAPSLIGKVAKTFAVGEAMSALKNPGDVQGEVSDMQLDKRMDNMKKDAPLNALFSAAGGFVSHKIDKLGQNKAMEAFKAVGPEMRDIKDAESRFRTEDLAGFIKKNGIIDGFPDAKTIRDRAFDAKERAGKVIGDIFKRNTPELAKKVPNALDSYDPNALTKILSNNREGEGEAAQAVVGKVQSIIDDIKANRGTDYLDLNDLHRIKQRVQDQVRNWKAAVQTDKNAGPMVDMFKDASHYFDDMMVDKLNQLGGKLGPELRIANRNFNLASNVDQVASHNYYTSEAATKGANIISDMLTNIAAPFRGKVPPMVSTPNLNAKVANLSPMASSMAQSGAQTLLPAGYQAIQPVPMLTPTQQEAMIKASPEMSLTEKAAAINGQRKTLKHNLTR